MHEFISKVHESVDCPVRNCTIGVTIRCPAYELQRTLQYGKLGIKRNADNDGCSNFSEEDVTIFYDGEGNAIDYDIPYTDPKIILNFTLIVCLVNYGADIQNIFIGTHDSVEEEGKWGELRQGFDDLYHSVSQANRHFFPPDPILVDGKPYEVAAVTVCNNLKCVSNSGKTNIDPLPLIMK